MFREIATRRNTENIILAWVRTALCVKENNKIMKIKRRDRAKGGWREVQHNKGGRRAEETDGQKEKQ